MYSRDAAARRSKLLHVSLLLVVGMSGCGILEPERTCTTEGRAGLQVVVVDVATGVAPTQATIVARDGSYADSLTMRASQGFLSAGLAVERAGTYHVEVFATGFVPWRSGPYEVERAGCHVRTVSVLAQIVRQE